MKKKLINALTLLFTVGTLVSCGGTSTSLTTSSVGQTSQTPSQTIEPIEINDVIASLRKGFKMTGTLTVDYSYFTDSTFQVPDTMVEEKTNTYTFEFNYEDSDTYTGLDRRFYKLEGDTKTYYYGENSFNDNGYAALNYLDYDNTVAQSVAVDSNGDLVPYGTNGLLNPFKLLQREDFKQTAEGFTLSPTKTTLLFTTLFAQVEDYRQNVTFETRNFNFTEDTLTSADLVSYNVDSVSASTVETEEDPHHQTFIRYNFTVHLDFSEIGTAKSSDMIAPLPVSEENDPLRSALANMVEKEEVTVKRRLTSYIDGEYVGYDNCLTVYYMGESEGIYSQSFNLAEGDSEPTYATTNDYILKPYKGTPNTLLRVYQLNDTTNKFSMNSANFGNLDNTFLYDDVKYDLSVLSADIFTKNEDGSYSPNADNLSYITRDLFMSTFDMFTPVDMGYVNDVRVYVNEDATCIDHIDIKYADFVGYSGLMTISYQDLGDSKPVFDIVIDE